MRKLELEELAELLRPAVKEVAPTAINREWLSVQEGPLRYFDREMRCTSRRCGSPTYLKVNGAPKCYTHALMKLNEIIVRMTNA